MRRITTSRNQWYCFKPSQCQMPINSLKNFFSYRNRERGTMRIWVIANCHFPDRERGNEWTSFRHFYHRVLAFWITIYVFSTFDCFCSNGYVVCTMSYLFAIRDLRRKRKMYLARTIMIRDYDGRFFLQSNLGRMTWIFCADFSYHFSFKRKCGDRVMIFWGKIIEICRRLQETVLRQNLQ